MVTAVESSISEQLRTLIRLQLVDSKIDQIKKLRGDLPDEIRDLEDERTGLETRIEKYETEAKENEVGKKQAGLDIKDAEDLIKKYEEQQLQVRNNREYDALTKEIEAQRNRIVEAQNRIEHIDGSKDEREEAIAAAKLRLEEMGSILSDKKAELEEVLNDTKSEQRILRRSARRLPAKSTRAIYEPTTGCGIDYVTDARWCRSIAEPPAVLPFLLSVRLRSDRATESSRASTPVESLSIWNCFKKRRRICRSEASSSDLVIGRIIAPFTER